MDAVLRLTGPASGPYLKCGGGDRLPPVGVREESPDHILRGSERDRQLRHNPPDSKVVASRVTF